jgi:hypothetical protein
MILNKPFNILYKQFHFWLYGQGVYKIAVFYRMSSKPSFVRKPAMTNRQIRNTINSIRRQEYKNALRQFQQSTSSGSNRNNLSKGMKALLESGGRRSRRTRKQQKRHTHRRR